MATQHSTGRARVSLQEKQSTVPIHSSRAVSERLFPGGLAGLRNRELILREQTLFARDYGEVHKDAVETMEILEVSN